MRGCGVNMPQTELYRHFDRAGNLLYVGVSITTMVRLNQHRCNSRWFKHIATITVEHFPTRKQAFDAERIAIREEKPLYNRMLNENKVEKQPGVFVSIGECAEILGMTYQHFYNQWYRKDKFIEPEIPGLRPKWHRAKVIKFAEKMNAGDRLPC